MYKFLQFDNKKVVVSGDITFDGSDEWSKPCRFRVLCLTTLRLVTMSL